MVLLTFSIVIGFSWMIQYSTVSPISISSDFCTASPPCVCRLFNNIVCSNVTDLSIIGAAVGIPKDTTDLPRVLIENTTVSELGPRAFGILQAKCIHVRFTNLSFIDDDAFIGVNENLTVLKLNNNRLQSVPSAALRKLTRLFLLELIYNRIARIEAGALNNMTRLSLLFLSENQIEEIQPEALPESLIYITLYKNRLSRIGGIFDRLQNIQMIVISNNNLSEITSSDIQPLKNLKAFHANENEIKTLNGAFNSLQKLDSVSFNHNRLTSLNSCFVNLPSLLDIKTAYNEITELPADTFLNCTSLQKVTLSHNKLKKIDDNAFRGNKFLEELDLSYNQLRNFPSIALSNLDDLKDLDLSFNFITHLNELHEIQMKSLKMLNFFGNPLVQISETLLNHVPALTTLVINSSTTLNIIVSCENLDIIKM